MKPLLEDHLIRGKCIKHNCGTTLEIFLHWEWSSRLIINYVKFKVFLWVQSSLHHIISNYTSLLWIQIFKCVQYTTEEKEVKKVLRMLSTLRGRLPPLPPPLLSFTPLFYVAWCHCSSNLPSSYNFLPISPFKLYSMNEATQIVRILTFCHYIPMVSSFLHQSFVWCIVW